MKIGSLFAGIGGIDLAFEQAGHTVVWANEFDSDACKTYRHNFPNTRLIENDIRNVNFDELEDVDVIAAGFPCQPFSICGYKKGFKDDRGNLFFEIMRAVDSKHPRIIFLENVANLTEHDNGRTFNVIHNELVSRGYFLRYIVADACDYGIPQHRTRTYLTAFDSLEECNKYEFPEKAELKAHITDIINLSVKADQNLYYIPGTPKFEKLNSFIDDSEQIYRFSDYGIQKSKGGISFTLKANMGTWYDRVPIVKDAYGIRIITPEECLKFQGFPINFTFPDIPDKSKYKQAGNTVVVPVVAKIIKMQYI